MDVFYVTDVDIGLIQDIQSSSVVEDIQSSSVVDMKNWRVLEGVKRKEISYTWIIGISKSAEAICSEVWFETIYTERIFIANSYESDVVSEKRELECRI